MIDTALEQGRLERLYQFVSEYAVRKNWTAIARLIGGSPRHDLRDYTEADHGEAPKGAQW